MNRRKLLLGSLASVGVLATTPALALVKPPKFVLYADGIHDDTLGIKALALGHDVEFRGRVNYRETIDSIWISNGVFYTPRGIPANYSSFMSCIIEPPFSTLPITEGTSKKVNFHHCTFLGKRIQI